MLNEKNYMDNECSEYIQYDDGNILRDEIIYELNDNLYDDAEVTYDNNSSDMCNTIPDKPCTMFLNDMETNLFDYGIIIDCLTSVPFQRSQSEISILSQLLVSIPMFMCINATKLEYICQAAKLISVDCVDQIIVKKCSVLKEWFLCLEGSLRKNDGIISLLGLGSFIGTDLWSSETLISDYDLYTNSDHCKLLVLGLSDLESTSDLNNLIIKTSDEDKSVIAVYESYRNVSDNNNVYSYVLIKGTVEVLLSHLTSNPKWVSDDYVEDFFLTHKLFLTSTRNIRNDVCNSLYLEDEYSKDKFDILIRWVSQSFPEFEKNSNLLMFINEIIKILKNQNNDHLLYNLYECCSNGAIVRDIKENIRLQDYIVPVKLTEHYTLYYIHQLNDFDPSLSLRNGDVIMELEGRSCESLSMAYIKSLSDECRTISMLVRNDLLTYHEHVLKDISMDLVSIYSTPSTVQYSSFSSDKLSDSISLSANDDDNNSIVNVDRNTNQQKRPVILPNLINTLQTGTIGRFFKSSKYYANILRRKRKTQPITTIPNNSRSNSDVASRLETLQNGNKEMSNSNFSFSRFSHHLKSKRLRQSYGSNVDFIKSFDDLELNENNPQLDCKSPIRICLKDIFINSTNNPNLRSDLRYFHMQIDPSTTVTEVIIRTLLKLNFTSASSTDYYLVEVKINERNGMIHEKTLSSNTSNLIDRVQEHSRFYLKHKSFIGESLLLPPEVDKMRDDLKLPSILQMSVDILAVRLFLRSFKLLCRITSMDLIDYVNEKAIFNDDQELSKSKSLISEYIHLSDFYKYWVITEVCSTTSNVFSRASTIKYFIHLTLKAMLIGHIDLFFSLISGLDSMEVLRLNLSWEKVSRKDKKLLQNLRTKLDVSGNMRNLRIIHQQRSNPIIPVTAMTVKDLTMLEETHHTYVSGTINELQANEKLINFDKMRKMARLARTFVNSCCSCCEDKFRPVRKHFVHCAMKWENHSKLERLLHHRLEHQSDTYFPKLCSHSLADKHSRKFSFSNISLQNSSSESLLESISSPKLNEERLNYEAFEKRIMILKIERYLKKIKDLVIINPLKLSEMSLICEQNSHIEGVYETKLRNSSKNSPYRLSKESDQGISKNEASFNDTDSMTNV